MTLENKRLTGIVLTVAVLLLVPFTAMQFTNEVNWKLSDFILAAVLLLGTGFLSELVIRKLKSNKYRVIFCAALLLAPFLIWLELALGVFGNPFPDHNSKAMEIEGQGESICSYQYLIDAANCIVPGTSFCKQLQ